MNAARSFPQNKSVGPWIWPPTLINLLRKLRMSGTVLPPPRILVWCANGCLYLNYVNHEMNTGFWAGKEIKIPEIFSEIFSSFVLTVDVLWFWKQSFQIPSCFCWQLCCNLFGFRSIIWIYGACCFCRCCGTRSFVNAVTSASAISVHCVMTVNFHFWWGLNARFMLYCSITCMNEYGAIIFSVIWSY